MANKPTAQKRTDPEMEALKDAWESGAQTKQAEITELKEQQSALSFLHRMAGKIEAMNFLKTQTDFFTLVMLKQVKESKEYRDKLNMTWEQFCESVGLKRRTVDENLEDLKPFKSEFLAAFRQFSGLEFSKIKYLGDAIDRRAAEIKGNKIIYRGEEISVTPEHAEDIQALLENLEETYNAQIEEQKAILRTKDKLIRAKEVVIHKQEKSLRKFEKSAEAKGLTLEEDAFLQRLENLRIRFDGSFVDELDPLKISELRETDEYKPTPRMTAALIERLGYMKRQVIAAYDTAVEMYGGIEADGGFTFRPIEELKTAAAGKGNGKH